jgi:hypothetical protein
MRPEQFLPFLSEQTCRAAGDVLRWQSEHDDWAPRDVVERACLRHYARAGGTRN